MVQPLDIAIVGAGVTGLAAAIMLRQSGHRVAVFERFDESRPVGSGLMLQVTGLAAMDRMGLRGAIEALGCKLDRLHGITDKGTTVFDLAYGAVDPALFSLGVHRAALHRVLWRGFEASGASLETGCTVAAIEAKSDGRAAAIDDTGRALASADLIVDASGARSPLRAAVESAAPRPFRYGAVWATVPDLGIGPATLAQRFVAARVMLGYLPLGRSEAGGPALAGFFWSLKPGEHAAWRQRFSEWRVEVAALWPALQPVVETFAGPDDLTLASYAQFTAKRVARLNVVLAGDAAHSTSPQLGQGANQGLIDAVVLADALAHARDIAGALASYAATRRRHIRFYQLAGALLTPFFQSDSRAAAAVRDLAFRRMQFVPYFRREMVRTMCGLKTGIFSSATPDAIVNGLARRADGT